MKGSSIYAALKGILDAGINLPYNKEILPSEDRIKGKHISDYALLLKNSEKYKKQFSQYLKNGSTPEDIIKNFDQVKEKILFN